MGKRAGPMRRLSRWAVTHWGTVTFCLACVVLGMVAVVWWFGLQASLRGQAQSSTGLLSFRAFDGVGWGCLGGMIAWLVFYWKTCATMEPGAEGRDSWRFGVRQHQRVFEGRPIEPGLLRAYGGFAAGGFVLGFGWALKLAGAMGWQDPAVVEDTAVVGLGLLGLAVLVLSAGLLHEVVFLHDFDHFVGHKAREYAKGLIEEERREIEAAREYNARRLRGWAGVVCVGGLGASLLIMPLLSDRDGTVAFQGCVSGLVLCAAGGYLLKIKPRRWRLSLGWVIAGAIGFVVFTGLSWPGSPLWLLAGVLWGAGVGSVTALLYVRQLETKQK